MTGYEQAALNYVRQRAEPRHAECLLRLQQICALWDNDAGKLIRQALQKPVTVNFHPDRLSNNGKTVLENLSEQGFYHGQFRTGISNGALGSKRLRWEQEMFGGAYPESFADRPKYGALNIFHFRDGASVRFGSCFFVLKTSVTDRCTFSYGDSSSDPEIICTGDTFAGILTALLRDVELHGRMLNQGVSTQQEALAILLHRPRKWKAMGRNLDFCIETHIHGSLSLQNDVERLFLDGSYRGTEVEQTARELCRKYGIGLDWIPERQIGLDEVGRLFRGPELPPFAEKIDRLFGGGGVINACLIGKAARDSIAHPERWSDSGTPAQVFQLTKQLWHTVGYFG